MAVQLGGAHIHVLLDSGSERSLISTRHLAALVEGGTTQVPTVLIKCVTAAGQNLNIVGEVIIS